MTPLSSNLTPDDWARDLDGVRSKFKRGDFVRWPTHAHHYLSKQWEYGTFWDYDPRRVTDGIILMLINGEPKFRNQRLANLQVVRPAQEGGI